MGRVIFVAAVTGGAALLHRLKIRHQTGVLAEHAAAVVAHPSSGRPAATSIEADVAEVKVPQSCCSLRRRGWARR